MKIFLHLFIVVMSVIAFATSCRNPAPGCGQFCSFRTNIKNGDNILDERGFGEFNRNGSPAVCGPYGGQWPSFDVLLTDGNQMFPICTNTGKPLDSKGLSPWFPGSCISMNQAIQYQGKNIKFRLVNVNNSDFLVRGNANMCPGQCALYYICQFSDDIRWTIDKKHCGINIDIKARAYKYGDNYVCKPCNC